MNANTCRIHRAITCGDLHYHTVSHSDLIMEYLVKLVGGTHHAGSDYCFDMGYEQQVEMVERLAVITDRERGEPWRDRGPLVGLGLTACLR